MATEHERILQSRAFNTIQTANKAQVTALVAGALKQMHGPAVPGVHPSEIVFDDPDSDPFAGNTNNRAVAQRIAKQRGKQYIAGALAIPNGDPDKAREDIEKSHRVNPARESPVVEEDDLSTDKPKPTPGSPAAQRLAADLAKTAETARSPITPIPSANAPEPGKPTGPPIWKPS
jgi:hypothetical protein